MIVERYLRAIAGFFVLVSVFLAYYHSFYRLIFTGFVDANLPQSAVANWCPVMGILRKLGEP